jgi:hypothetical protein
MYALFFQIRAVKKTILWLVIPAIIIIYNQGCSEFVCCRMKERGRSQWPRCLRHELSSLAWAPWSWVRIQLKAWMSVLCVCFFCVYVVLCVGRGLVTGWSPVQGVLPTVCNLKSGQGPAKSCRGIIVIIIIIIILIIIMKSVCETFLHSPSPF